MTYAVQALRASTYYTDDKDAAEAIFEMLIERQCEEVELLKDEDEDGHYIKVK